MLLQFAGNHRRSILESRRIAAARQHPCSCYPILHALRPPLPTPRHRGGCSTGPGSTCGAKICARCGSMVRGGRSSIAAFPVSNCGRRRWRCSSGRARRSRRSPVTLTSFTCRRIRWMTSATLHRFSSSGSICSIAATRPMARCSSRWRGSRRPESYSTIVFAGTSASRSRGAIRGRSSIRRWRPHGERRCFASPGGGGENYVREEAGEVAAHLTNSVADDGIGSERRESRSNSGPDSVGLSATGSSRAVALLSSTR